LTMMTSHYLAELLLRSQLQGYYAGVGSYQRGSYHYRPHQTRVSDRYRVRRIRSEVNFQADIASSYIFFIKGDAESWELLTIVR
jgi:hypothetical protein